MTQRRQRDGGKHMRAFTCLLLAYVVIASLHGLAPQLWARHFGEDHDNGPFRILLFSPILAASLAVLLVCGMALHFSPPLPERCPSSRAAWSPRSLRGPPSSR